MTSISTDSSTPTVASVRRTQEVERTRAAGTGTSEPTASDTSPRPSTVVNLNSSARQAALNGLTYGNLRSPAATRNAASDDANRVTRDIRDTREIQGSRQAERTERSEHAERRAEDQGQTQRQQERQTVERQVGERQSNEHQTVQRQDDQAVQAIQSASQAETAERV